MLRWWWLSIWTDAIKSYWEKSKETKDFMSKVERGNVHCNKYDGCYMKQWVIIPKATWTSPNKQKRLTCRTSFNKAFFMKDDLNDEMPNGTLKTLIPSDGVKSWNGMLKLGNRPRENHVTHFLGWIKRFFAWSSIWKCSYAIDIIEGGLWCECHMH